jgi:hypothetical protein
MKGMEICFESELVLWFLQKCNLELCFMKSDTSDLGTENFVFWIISDGSTWQYMCDFGPFGGDQWSGVLFRCYRIISEVKYTFIHMLVSACFLCLTVVALGTSGRAQLQCPVCPRTFVSKANLLVHAKNEHGDDRGPFSCSICGRIAKNKNSLRVHIYLYHRKKWKIEKQAFL